MNGVNEMHIKPSALYYAAKIAEHDGRPNISRVLCDAANALVACNRGRATLLKNYDITEAARIKAEGELNIVRAQLRDMQMGARALAEGLRRLEIIK